MKKMKYPLLLAVLLMVPAAFSGYQDKDFELSKNLDIYHSLMRELNQVYVDGINPERMITSSINQMLATLDPYTVYVPESSMEDLQLMTTGEYGGVGALISKLDNQIVITDPYEGFPAQKAGLRAGDIINKVDGRSVADLSSSEVSDLMKGQIGSAVEMEVIRPFWKDPVKVKLVREKIKIGNVPHEEMLTDQTGYIRISGFTQGASKEVGEAFNRLKEQGLKNLILDFRSNPGGLLIEAVDMMNLFVNQNVEIVSTRGKVEQWNNTYYTRRQPVDTLIHIALLINSQSASAAEIVAGAMQDLDRGVILGQRSFGKGLVQTTRDLSYNSKLKVTTAKYYIPSGRCIQALDYSHRRPDGSVGHIPDSLITDYKTHNGRIVQDGGGIVPDITIEPRMLSKFATALVYKNEVFDFATRLRNTREQTPDMKTFSLSESDLEGFGEQLRQSNFSYETGSERKLKELRETIDAEQYDNISEQLLDQLQKDLGSNTERDLKVFREEVITLLEEEVLSRYYFEKGRTSRILREDPVVLKALEVLNQPDQYQLLLAKKN